MQAMPLTPDEHRLFPIFRLGRIVSTFSMIDTTFIVLWGVLLRFYVLLLVPELLF